MTAYTQEDKERAIELYKSGLSSYKIASITGISKSTVQKWASEAGVVKRGNRNSQKQKKEKIKEMYLKGMNCDEIGEILGESEGAISYHVREMGISRGRGVQSPIRNEHYFDEINTEDKAYWLGYIMADGNVSTYNNQYSLKLHVQYKDKEIIDEFLKYVDCDNKPLHKEDNNSYYVSLSSKHMINKLIEYGVTPAKSGKEVLPNMPDKLVRHFIRGYFDGDGITCVTEGNKRSGFVGGESIINSIHEITSSTQKIYPQGKVFYFQGGIKYSKRLYDYMYTGATIWLKRKRDRMDVICGNTEVTQ